MASHLSEEEFQRLQTQLIELRTANYGHEERCRKQRNEIEDLRGKLEVMEREYQKTQKILNRSRKARDVELLLNENESLQMKLQSQEDEFRLQNQTLLKELSTLVSSNEKLERDMAVLTGDGSSTEENHLKLPSKTAEKMRHLQALALALEKSLEEAREKHKSETMQLRQTVYELSEANQSLEKQLNRMSDSLPAADLGTPSDDGDFVQVGESEVSYRKQCGTTLEALRQAEEHLSALEEDLKQLEALKLELSVEREEKQSLQTQVSGLQGEVGDLQEKLCRKQESVRSLQEERERAFQEAQEAKEQLSQVAGQAEAQRSALREKEEALREKEEALREKDEAAAEARAAVEREEQTQVLLVRSQEEARELREQSRVLLKEMEEMRGTCDQRRALLEEMAAGLQRTNQQHHDKCQQLQDQLVKAQTELMELLQLPMEVKRLEEELQLAQEDKERLSAELEERETELIERKRDCEEEVERMKMEEMERLQNLQEDYYDKEQDLKTEIELIQAQKTEFEEAIRSLRQEVRDSLEERRLHERKGASILKDLKRQLQAERKRGEKLQETLREVLSKGVGGVAVSAVGCVGATDNDACSISSWSLMSGNADHKEGRDGSFINSSPSALNGNHSPTVEDLDLEQENFNLLSRITALQQEKWGQEERINHLEQSNAAMAEDLMKKSALIQFYCIEGKAAGALPSPHSDRPTVRRLVELIKNAGDESIREANQKLQKMLEDTLTKNMQLQKELENLSSEVVRLSKVAGSSQT